ncbi:MAG: hypothetical protein RRA94_10260, partial [Bacteroidota bacterium]|nr:hypothetical protein [Bacteroidota bacterium]
AYELPQSMYVRLAVYSMQGRRIAVLAEGSREAGRHVAAWNAEGLPAGSYLLRLLTDTGVQEKHCVLLR